MDYSKLSDFEINKRVAEALGVKMTGNVSEGIFVYSESEIIIASPITGRSVRFDPCNNPADAWPVIVENRICITFGSGAGSALRVRGGNTYQYVASKYKMLRAAMIVFLMMSEK